MELLSYLTSKLGKTTLMHNHRYMNIDNVDLHREFDSVFGDYCWVRLRSGLPTYLGRLTLLYGDSSVWRCFPTTRLEGIGQGRNRGARGEGQTFYGIDWKSRNFLLIYNCIYKYIRLDIKQLAEVNCIMP
jgi:hypothetical protein